MMEEISFSMKHPLMWKALACNIAADLARTTSYGDSRLETVEVAGKMRDVLIINGHTVCMANPFHDSSSQEEMIRPVMVYSKDGKYYIDTEDNPASAREDGYAELGYRLLYTCLYYGREDRNVIELAPSGVVADMISAYLFTNGKFKVPKHLFLIVNR